MSFGSGYAAGKLSCNNECPKTVEIVYVYQDVCNEYKNVFNWHETIIIIVVAIVIGFIISKMFNWILK